MNRKIILSTISLAFCFISLTAQGLRFSFLANPQLTWLSDDQAGIEKGGAMLKLNTGIAMDVFFADNYAFSTGLTINSLGGGLIYPDSIYLGTPDGEQLLEPGSNLDYNLQYISIPVGLKFKSVEIGYTTIWLNTGVNPMFQIKSKASNDTGSFDKTSLEDETGALNFAYFIKAGIEYSIGGNTAIIGGLGYTSGMMDITSRPSEKVTTQSISLVIGILF